MPSEWRDTRVLILVRTYPIPAKKDIEVSCTAGITEQGKWLRLFPIPYRFLEEDKRFKKYQWVDVSVMKAKSDPRPESYKLNADTIRIRDWVSPDNEWRERRRLIHPLIRPSLCGIQRERDEKLSPTLGIFKPTEIRRLLIEQTVSEWTAQQLACLKQTDLFRATPSRTLEKIPFIFRYEFQCADASCAGHTLMCTDWEMGQSYRKWQRKYGTDWEREFRRKYEHEMINRFDTHFFVGTIHQYPNSWIIVGLFYPPPKTSYDLFG